MNSNNELLVCRYYWKLLSSSITALRYHSLWREAINAMKLDRLAIILANMSVLRYAFTGHRFDVNHLPVCSNHLPLLQSSISF